MSTGLQGQSLVSHLSQTGNYRIRALTRNPFSKTDIKLAKLQNVEVLQADLLEKSSLENSFRDAHVIFGILLQQLLGRFSEEACFVSMK